MGVTALVLGVGVALWMQPLTGVGRWLVFVLFWFAGLGLFQAKKKT